MISALEQLAGQRILLLNWRDLSNPAAGGAESYTEQIARRFVRAGATVTLFTSAYPGGAPYDWSNGYLVIRKGSRFGVYWAAARHLKRYAGQYDAVIDFQNGIPFFAPRWAPPAMPVVCVIHHVHQRQFDLYFPWPMNHVGRLLEGRVSRRVYGDRPMVAVSPSTRAEMRRELAFRGPVSIVPNGVDVPPPSALPRSAGPTIALVTRLVPHKQIDQLVAAVPELLRRWPELRVTIAGTGAGRPALAEQVRGLGLEAAVSLPGRVSEQAKSDLLSRAWLTVAPSAAEGWGLTVIEANAVGTPAVAYDVPGLRDSVRHGVTGWLAQPGQSLAAALAGAIDELSDPGRQQAVAEQARAWAAGFSWDSSAERLADVLLTEIWHRALGSPGRRRPVDLATVASWPPELSDELIPILRKALRVTDIIVSDDEGLRVLLIGCDELGAAKALQRVPVPPAALQLATTARVLAGKAGKVP
ncbi:MAG TPA: glycosyltransferase family 4 protein [Trebonia sp.]|nr:glycosyltransferase family 4 protein [Trebonia sp.]